MDAFEGNVFIRKVAHEDEMIISQGTDEVSCNRADGDEIDGYILIFALLLVTRVIV